MCRKCENRGGENRPVRPMCLELVDAKVDIFGIINALHEEKNIPLYLLEPIVSEAYRQVRNCARAERESAMKDYTDKLAEYEKKVGERDGERV